MPGTSTDVIPHTHYFWAKEKPPAPKNKILKIIALK
jgi:hypothetical protein